MTKWSERDRQLGMDRPISRRDFLNGVGADGWGRGCGAAWGSARGRRRRR